MNNATDRRPNRTPLERTAAVYLTGGRASCVRRRGITLSRVDAPAQRTPEQIGACLALRDRVAAGCSEPEFEVMRCPVCGAPVILNVHHNHSTFSVRCSRHWLDLMLHGTSDLKMHWWTKYMRGGWY